MPKYLTIGIATTLAFTAIFLGFDLINILSKVQIITQVGYAYMICGISVIALLLVFCALIIIRKRMHKEKN